MSKEDKSNLREVLGVGEGESLGVFNAPNFMDEILAGLPDSFDAHRVDEHRGGDGADVYLIFADAVEEAERAVQRAMTQVPEDGVIWVAWPQADQDIENDAFEADLNDVLSPLGLTRRDACFLNDEWRGISFTIPQD